MSYGGLNEVFSAIAAARQKHARKNRAKRRLAGGAIISAFLIIAVTVLAKKSALAKEFVMELAIGVAAAVTALVLEPFLKLKSLFKAD